METKDLRTTNLIEYNGKICAVNAIDFVDIRVSYWSNEERTSSTSVVINIYDDAKPIPLTKEWLIDFGFEYNEEYEYFKYMNYAVSTNDLGYCFLYLLMSDEEYTALLEFKHVHQLQNLYFALTGKELIKK